MKLIKNAEIINLFVIIFLVTEDLAQKNFSYLNQSSKTKYLLKIKTAKCSLTA